MLVTNTSGVPDHGCDMVRYTVMARPSAGITKEESLEDQRATSEFSCEDDWEEIMTQALPTDGYEPINVHEVEGIPLQ
ncbi:MAG: hypothetical protein ACLFPU_11085 [Dehalococcoidia bacterium]